MDWKRKLFGLICVFIGCILLFELCLKYPSFDLFFRSYGKQNQDTGVFVTTEDSQNPTTSEKEDIIAVPAPQYIPKDSGQISYITQGISGGNFEYTLHDVKIYDSYEEANVSLNECTPSFEENESFQKQKFMLFDMSIKNIDAHPGVYDDPQYPFVLNLWVMYTEAGLSGNYDTFAYECYFSKHPPQKSNSTNYYHYNLEIGEQMDFQYGISVPSDLLENEGFVLCLGSYEDKHYFNPFDAGFTGVIES